MTLLKVASGSSTNRFFSASRRSAFLECRHLTACRICSGGTVAKKCMSRATVTVQPDRCPSRFLFSGHRRRTFLDPKMEFPSETGELVGTSQAMNGLIFLAEYLPAYGLSF